jgi:hypothetical protein
MSIIATNWVWQSVSSIALTPSARLVILRLADRANTENICWPGVESIAQDCGISEISARKGLKELAQKKLILIERRQDAKKRDVTNKYVLLITGGNKIPPGSQNSNTMRGKNFIPNHHINPHKENDEKSTVKKADALKNIELLKNILM